MEHHHFKTYLITFYTDKASNGYAVVNACNPKQAETILKTQGRNREEKYRITDIEELFAPCDGLAIVNEGITTSGLSAYQIALLHGYKGTESLWIKEMQSAIDTCREIKIEQLKYIEDSIKKIISDSDLIHKAILNSMQKHVFWTEEHYENSPHDPNTLYFISDYDLGEETPDTPVVPDEPELPEEPIITTWKFGLKFPIILN